MHKEALGPRVRIPPFLLPAKSGRLKRGEKCRRGPGSRAAQRGAPRRAPEKPAASAPDMLMVTEGVWLW